jgi:hypothetical protein
MKTNTSQRNAFICVHLRHVARYPILTNDAAPPTMNSVTITRNTASPSCMSAHRNTLTHQYARSSCRFEDIDNALHFKCRTLLVRARTNRLRNSFRLLPRDVSVDIWIIAWWTQVCFTAHKNYGDYRTTSGPHFFDPLKKPGNDVDLFM